MPDAIAKNTGDFVRERASQSSQALDAIRRLGLQPTAQQRKIHPQGGGRDFGNKAMVRRERFRVLVNAFENAQDVCGRKSGTPVFPAVVAA